MFVESVTGNLKLLYGVLQTYLTEDISGSLIFFHIYGAKTNPGSTFGIAVVVRLVLIL